MAMQTMAPPTALQRADETDRAAAIMEQVIAQGDLANLTPAQRAHYYIETCRSVGLNYLTKPFDYIELNRKLTLYATRNATDQLRRIYSVSVRLVKEETIEGVRIITAEASDASGRTDTSIGAVPIGGLRGVDLANALMKCETKAKRRATLSFVGLSFLDETEVETVPSARRVQVDPQTGEMLDGGSRTEPTSATRGGGNRTRQREERELVPDWVPTGPNQRHAQTEAEWDRANLEPAMERKYPKPTPEPPRPNRPRPQTAQPTAGEPDIIEVDPVTGEILPGAAGTNQPTPSGEAPESRINLGPLHGDIGRRFEPIVGGDIDAHRIAKRLGRLWFDVKSLTDLTPKQLHDFRKKLRDLSADDLMAEDGAARDLERQESGELAGMPNAIEVEGDAGADRFTR